MNIGALLVLGFCDDPVHKDYFMYYRKSRSHCIFFIYKKYNVTGFPELHFKATTRSECERQRWTFWESVEHDVITCRWRRSWATTWTRPWSSTTATPGSFLAAPSSRVSSSSSSCLSCVAVSKNFVLFFCLLLTRLPMMAPHADEAGSFSRQLGKRNWVRTDLSATAFVISLTLTYNSHPLCSHLSI